MSKLNRFMRWLMVAGAAIVFAIPAAAQTYPNKPIRILVGFGTGGSTDIVARLLAQSLSAAVGQPVIVENKPGAGGRIAADTVAKSPADGYSLLMGSAGIVVARAVGEKMGFDLVKDFVAVARVADNAHVLIVGPTVAVKTVPELVSLLREKPGATYASSGPQTSLHVAGALFGALANLKLTHVPYKSGAQAVQDLMSGEVTMMFNDLPTIVSQVNGGVLRALAVTGSARSPRLPNVPTMAEAGYPGVNTTSWFGLMAPAGTPKAVVQELNTKVNQVLQQAQLRTRFQDLGMVTTGGTQEEFNQFLEANLSLWTTAVKLTGTSLE